MRFEHQLKTFLRILKEYPLDTPLTKFLPGFFKQNKQMGSNDRRVAGRLIYSYFRMGRACAHLPADQRLFLGEYLCSHETNPFLEHFRPDLHQTVNLSLSEKIQILEEKEGFVLDDVYPWTGHLSDGINKEEFLRSFFVQPDLFIRLHPGKESLVKAKLEEAGVSYHEMEANCLALDNGTRLNQLFPDNRPYEVQDLSSQRTAAYFKAGAGEYWWDACAASGGKSLLLFHSQPAVKLLVSDIRESILNNLDERFREAGLLTYQKKVLDLTKTVDPELHHYEFDGIILDAPCSGSGTWGRTPEMISQFQERKIMQFQHLQKTIAANVVKYLKPGKPLIYITCSAFRQENEAVVEYLVSEVGLKLEQMQVLTGYREKADTMYVARLVSN
ncbi:MAG TPA: RsmB/NOP family class I SAM-dependent RNA methyltransferase [Sphingobacteriaceae bacterium]